MLMVSSVRLVKTDEPAAVRTDSSDSQMHHLTPSATAATTMPPADPSAPAWRLSTPAGRRGCSPPLRPRRSRRRPLGSLEIRSNRHSLRRFDEADAEGARGSHGCRALIRLRTARRDLTFIFVSYVAMPLLARAEVRKAAKLGRAKADRRQARIQEPRG
jgi:hypothetical protein